MSLPGHPMGARLRSSPAAPGGYRVYVMNSDGSGVTQLSNQAYSFHPVWSPDGSQIAYDADGDDDGFQEIWLMNADGSNQHLVYKPGGTNVDAWVGGWSPDGRYVAFTQIYLGLLPGKLVLGVCIYQCLGIVHDSDNAM